MHYAQPFCSKSTMSYSYSSIEFGNQAATSGTSITITRLTDQADALLAAFIENPASDAIQKALETLWAKIADLTKNQKEIDIAKEETERIRLQQLTYVFQSNNWRDVQIAQANAQISSNYWQQQQAMYVAYQSGMTATYQALALHYPQAIDHLFKLTSTQSISNEQPLLFSQ